MRFRNWILVIPLWLCGCGRAPPSEEQAVWAVEKLGGKVVRDETEASRPLKEVYLNGNQVTDAELKLLTRLKNLSKLHLSETRVTDAGLKELSSLKMLTTLSIINTPVTDAGMKEFAALTGLTTLILFHTQVTDAGLKELAPLTTLTCLCLGCSLTTRI